MEQINPQYSITGSALITYFNGGYLCKVQRNDKLLSYLRFPLLRSIINLPWFMATERISSEFRFSISVLSLLWGDFVNDVAFLF